MAETAQRDYYEALGVALFDGFFHRRSSGAPRGANIEIELAIPLEQGRQ